MTLREKFTAKESIITQGEAIRFAYESVKVAEEFAMNFASWVLIYMDIEYDSSLSMEEVLEIYKKTL